MSDVPDIPDGTGEKELRGWTRVEFTGDDADKLTDEVYDWLKKKEDEIIAYEILASAPPRAGGYTIAVKIRRKNFTPAMA